MRQSDPANINVVVMTPILLVDLEDQEAAYQKTANADLIVLLLISDQTDTLIERQLLVRWSMTEKKLLVIINHQSSRLDIVR
jgi:hypothetical protein